MLLCIVTRDLLTPGRVKLVTVGTLAAPYSNSVHLWYTRTYVAPHILRSITWNPHQSMSNRPNRINGVDYTGRYKVISLKSVARL